MSQEYGLSLASLILNTPSSTQHDQPIETSGSDSEGAQTAPDDHLTSSGNVRIANRSPDEKLRIANTFLAAGSPGAALDLYTELLKAGHSGHAYVFLNRSLCYLMLDYPSLAATDAYRAMVAGQIALEPGALNIQGVKIRSYASLVNKCREENVIWAKSDTGFAGGKSAKGTFLGMALANLGCYDRAKGGSVKVRYSKDVVLRGHFRLALALFRCGGGALRSALDVLGDAQALQYCTAVDDDQFAALGNHILEFMEQEFLVEKPDLEGMQRMGLLPKKGSSPEVESYQMTNFRGLLQTRYTKIKRELYPWDNHSLRDQNESEKLDSINRWVKGQAPGSCVRASNREGKVPKLSLHVDRHFDPGIIYEEASALYVSSSLLAGTWLSCNSCGTAMDAPAELMRRANLRAEYIARKDEQEAAETYQRDRSPSPAAFFAKPSETKKETELSLGERKDSLDQQGQADNRPRTAAQEDLGDGDVDPNNFRICESCKAVAYCDAYCQSEATHIHLPMCGSGLDEALSYRVIPAQWRDLPGPEHQTLLNLMLLRVLSMFRDQSEALAFPWMKIFDGDLDKPRVMPTEKPKKGTPMYKKEKVKYDDFYPPDLRDIFHDYDDWNLGSDVEDDAQDAPNMIPWSFDANVRFPIQCLMRLGGASAALEVKRYDGWVLNTIIAKLEAAMRITKHPRFERYFDAEGNLTAQRPVHPQEEDAVHDQAWIGSLHPLFSLVPVARPGQVPNVVVEERLANLNFRAINTIHPKETLYTDSMRDSEKPDLSVPLIRSARILSLREDDDMDSAAGTPPPRETANADTMAKAADTSWAAFAPDEYVREDADMDVETMGPGGYQELQGDVDMIDEAAEDEEDASMYDPIG